MSNIKPFFVRPIVAKNVCTSADVSARHFGTGTELSGHFATSRMVPKCLGSEVVEVS